MSAESPFAIAKEIPVSAPNLEIHASGRDRVKQAFTSWFPPAQKSNVAVPPRILGLQWTMHLIAITERHIDNRFAEHLVLFLLIRLAVNKHVEGAHGCIH